MKSNRQLHPRADYEANVEEARREKETSSLRPLKSKVPNWSQYERVFLGFPIWGGTAPAIIRSFLIEHDTSDKVLVPFITHGKYGLGDSLSVVRSHSEGATLLKGYSEECDQERDTMESVDRHGGDVTVIHLPEIGLHGNTHFPMSDLNNVDVANYMMAFLESKGLTD